MDTCTNLNDQKISWNFICIQRNLFYSCNPIIEMKMGDLLTNDIKETLHLDILVVAARKFFERIEFRDYSFGIMDIVNPQPKVSPLKY